MERSGVYRFIRATIFFPVFVAWTCSLNFLSGEYCRSPEESSCRRIQRVDTKSGRSSDFDCFRSSSTIEKAVQAP
uniref:Putative transmembrane protein n=1 Tax=Toxoplasma gondii COUG TaxID=1074873 RepID=A0A2G8Y6X7_TOXGO|nr:putative transmembrane protein [Toxoplasma gondii COUG]